jgi:MatE
VSTQVGNAIGQRDTAGPSLRTPLGAAECNNMSSHHGLVPLCQTRTSPQPLPTQLNLKNKQVYGYLFSNNKSVIHLVSQVMLLIASFQVVDSLAGSCGGVLRGQGRQHLGAVFHVCITIFKLMPPPDSYYPQARWWCFLSWVCVSMWLCGLVQTGIMKLGRGGDLLVS